MRRWLAFPKAPSKVRPLAVAIAAVAALACAHPLHDTIEGARLYGAGTRALDRGDPAGAIDRLERAARLVPHASEIRHHLGLAYQASGEPERARAALETAVALDCENDAARRSLARLLASTGPNVPAHPGAASVHARPDAHTGAPAKEVGDGG